MKKNYLLATFLLFCLSTYSQYVESAPWVDKSNTTQKKEEAKFADIVNSFNEYWKGRDYTKKGSGYKPFKRWEQNWKTQLNDQGYIMTYDELLNAWEQKKSAKKRLSTSRALPASNWTPVGPFANATTQQAAKTRARGRVNIITVDPSNPNTLYFGAPAGGLWKSTNSGTSWTALTDELPQIGVSGIAVDPSNSSVIYIATGDKDGGDTYSVGVLKSTDGGATWNTTGLSFAGSGNYLGDILINPSNPQIVICASSNGIYRTTNGGGAWTLIQSGSNFSQGSIRFKPNDPSIVYAVSSNLYFRSSDSGATFTNIAVAGITNTGNNATGRLLLDITPADPNYVYILSSKASAGNYAFNGIFRSTNSGVSFARSSQTIGATNVLENTQAWYDLAFAASSTTLNELYVGCLNVWKTTDAGAVNANWTKLNDWATYNPSFTHADIHHLQFFNNKLYCGSDGGIYITTDKGVNFTDITGEAQITQFYKIAVSKQTASKIAGGTQDNGGYGFSNSTWKGYHGGDGMDCAVNPINGNVFYGFIYYGQTMYVSDNGGESLSTAVTAPDLEKGTNDGGSSDVGSSEWVTPMIANKEGDLFSGYKRLYKLDNCTSTWVQQSTGTIGTGDVELISVDPSNSNNMYVSNDNVLYKSTNKGVTFTSVYTATTEITSITVHSTDSNIIYLTTAGTTGSALKSTNGGAAFTSIGNGIPNIAKFVIKHQDRNPLNPLYVGTSLGVYYRDDSMSQFEPFDTNLPNVPIRDLEINVEDGLLIAGTYGRGVWQTAIPVQTPANDLKSMALLAPNLNINCTNTISPEITVKNTGTNSISSVNITYDYNGSPQNYVWNGTIAPSASQLIAIPAFNVTYRGAYTLTVTSTVAGDAYSENNILTTPFYINDSGTLNAINNFESASSVLIASSSSSCGSQTGWQKGIKTDSALATGSNNVYTTNFSGNYPDKTKSYLYSQCYDLRYTSNPQIKFKMGFDLELNWDVVYVEYSTNMGQTWNVLGTQGTNWYNSNRTLATAGNDCYNCPGAQWTGTDTTLKEYFYPLSSLVGQSNVIFRIVFHSDDSENKTGVIVDDFVIEGTLANEDFELNNVQIYPNPSKDIFTIALGNKPINKLEVYDVSGKIIFETKNQSDSTFNLNLSNASSGIYFVKIESQGQNIVKRIIKN